MKASEIDSIEIIKGSICMRQKNPPLIGGVVFIRRIFILVVFYLHAFAFNRRPEFFQTVFVARGEVETLQHVCGHAIGVFKTLVCHLVREVLRHGVVEVVQVPRTVLLVRGAIPNLRDTLTHLALGIAT